MRIRFATHGAALTVRNLLPVVTNELLEQVNWTRAVKSQTCSADLLVSMQ